MIVDPKGEAFRSLGREALSHIEKGAALALLIGGKDPAFGRELLTEAAKTIEATLDELENQGISARLRTVQAAPPRDREVPVGGREDAADIEAFILDLLGPYPEGCSIQQMLNAMDEANMETPRRETLVVRLHRMAKVGKIIGVGHGHYRLPDPAARQRAR